VWNVRDQYWPRNWYWRNRASGLQQWSHASVLQQRSDASGLEQ